MRRRHHAIATNNTLPVRKEWLAGGVFIAVLINALTLANITAGRGGWWLGFAGRKAGDKE
jgi:hypothetical protein